MDLKKGAEFFVSSVVPPAAALMCLVKDTAVECALSDVTRGRGRPHTHMRTMISRLDMGRSKYSAYQGSNFDKAAPLESGMTNKDLK